MTERLKGVTVAFDHDIREDDAQQIINAIRMIKGVLEVVPSVVNSDDDINRSKIEYELSRKLWEVLGR